MNTVNIRFTAIALIFGAILVTIGGLIRPVGLEQSFEISNFLEINKSMNIWIRSFQALVFGLFIQIIGLVGLSTFYHNSLAKTIVYPGVMVCVLALFLSAICQGYYMHVGAWGGWNMSEISSTEQVTFFESLTPTHEWVICLVRMGKMFFCLGFFVLGIGLFRGEFLRKWIGIVTSLIGVGGMILLMIYPEGTAIYIPIDTVITIWFILTGTILFIDSVKT